jgi:hypothetical protein
MRIYTEANTSLYKVGIYEDMGNGTNVVETNPNNEQEIDRILIWTI